MKARYVLWFTLVYLACEVIYNLGLVDFLTSKNTEISVFSSLENFGKALSSIGLSLFLIKFAKSMKAKAVAMAILVPCMFFGETAAFDKLVDDLSPQAKVGGYVSGVYRNAVLNGSISDSRISGTDPYSRVLLADVGTLTGSQAMKEKVQGLLKVGADDSALSGMYSQYSKVSDEIDPYYVEYAIQSKRYSGYSGRKKQYIDEQFEKKDGGIPPGLDKADFMKAVSEKSPAMRQFSNMVIIAGNKGLGIQEVKGSDLPLGMSQSQFVGFFKTRLDDIAKKTTISESTVDSLPYSRDMISSIYVPPIAIFLSFLSILLNSGTVLAAISGDFVEKKVGAGAASATRLVAAVLPFVIAAVFFASFDSNPYSVEKYMNKGIGVESEFFGTLSPVAKAIHAVAINDDHPDYSQIVRISKPKPIDFSDIEKSVASMKGGMGITLPTEDARVTADPNKLETDPNYYGEIKVKINPYTGKPMS